MRVEPELFTVPVPGGALNVARWGSGPRLVLGVHGITASSAMFRPVVRKLGEEFTFLAPDLRGRGLSAALSGPYGMPTHASDCAAVIESAGLGPAIVCGVSMGAFVSVVLGASRPELVSRLLLVDGGYPLPLPPGMDVDTFLKAILGPALARLEMTFPSVDAYLDFWRAHPAVGEEWSEDLEAYLAADLTGEPPTLRSRVNPASLTGDNADQIGDETVVRRSLAQLAMPVHLLRATRDILNNTPPLYHQGMVDRWRTLTPHLTDEIVDDTNHYTIIFGERGSKIISERITEHVV